jgi:PKD repeat protein
MKKTLYPLLLLTLCCFSPIFGQNNTAVLLHTGVTSFPENVKEYAATATIGNHEMIDGHYYRLLQFYSLPDQPRQDQMAQQGIELLEYIPHNTYLASIPTNFDGAKLEQLGVRSIQYITTEMKESADIRYSNFPDWAMDRNDALLMLKFYKNLRHEDVAAYCAADGITILNNNGYNNFFKVKVPLDRVAEVVNLPYVAFLELVPPPSVPDDILGKALHRSNVIDAQFPSGRHYTGEGVNVLVRDDGFVGPHIDFQGRIDNSFVDPQQGGHGDGVAGVMAGAGNLDPWLRGSAAGSFVYVVNYESDFLDETMDLFYDNDVIVTNSSYSNGCNAGYTEITETVDQQLYNNPTLLHVFSAGNSNNNDCGYGAGSQWGNITGGHKMAKNSMTTANLYADASLVGSSSRGPAHDGRIKPDIAANGQDQLSTNENNTYQVFGGTSAAAPSAAGVVAQLHQAYRDLNNGETAEAALLKSVMLNTTNELGNAGPDFKYGWGQVNAYRAALALEEHRYLKGSVGPGNTTAHTLTIPAGVVQARVMVYWMDPEATVMTDKALINDIDISMTDPNAEEHLPWLLDPTPDPAILNTPAARGVDTLNNMEQVTIENPVAGDYTLNVNGTELPFGSHDYFVTWEYRTSEITVTHPVGAESFAPGDTLRIHWDTEGDNSFFVISYSIDSGTNWTNITSENGEVRMSDWIVPDEITPNAMIKVKRGPNSDTNDEPFSIAPRPQNLSVEQACPDYIRFTWDPVVLDSATTTSYIVYLLGDKYMEPLDTTTDIFYDLPTIGQNPTLDYWVAVKSLGEDGAVSERTLALKYNGGLLNCDQEHDLSMLTIDSPDEGSILGCGSLEIPVTVTVKNIGLSEETGVSVAYQFNNNPPVVEVLPNPLQPGESVTYTFSTPINTTQSGEYSLLAYTILTDDSAAFNNSVSQQSSLSIYPGVGEPLEYSEDFEGVDFPPAYYLINNADGALTWEEIEVIGAGGSPTFCMFINNFAYNASGEEDDMLVVPIDLSGSTIPLLSFDLAYARFNSTFQDGMRIEISTDCGLTFNDVIYDKSGSALATVPDVGNVFFPTSGNQWRNEKISLADYAGSSVVLKFVAVNGYGNSLFADNINVMEITPPVAGFTTSADTICQGETITFTNTSEGPGVTYAWDFGSGASPSQSSDEGPIDVTFNEEGPFTVTLSVVNIAGQSTSATEVFVTPLPAPDFDFTNVDETVTFENLTAYGNSYIWNFGDGVFALTENPFHTYDSFGFYTVVLTVTNDCGTETITKEIEVLLTDVQDISNRLSVAISPNPATDAAKLVINTGRSESLTMEILDVRGVVIEKRVLHIASGVNVEHLEVSALPAGLYLLKISANDGFTTLRLLIE